MQNAPSFAVLQNSAILLTFIKLPFAIKTPVDLSIVMTGFTVLHPSTFSLLTCSIPVIKLAFSNRVENWILIRSLPQKPADLDLRDKPGLSRTKVKCAALLKGCLESDQAQRFVRPDLIPKCLPRLSVDQWMTKVSTVCGWGGSFEVLFIVLLRYKELLGASGFD